jgi:hypothetical protein
MSVKPPNSASGWNRRRLEYLSLDCSLVAAIDRTRQRLPFAATVTLALLAGASAGLLTWWGAKHQHVGLIIAMGIICAFPPVLRAAQGKWDPFEPIQLFTLAMAVIFVGRPLAELAYHINTYFNYLVRPGFDPAMLIGIVGTLAVYVGYFSRIGDRIAKRIKPLPHTWDRKRSVRFAIGTLILCALLTAGFAATIGGFGALVNLYRGRNGAQGFLTVQAGNAYFAQGPYLTIPVSFILLAAWGRQRSIGVGLLLILSIGTALLITVPGGDRTFILQLLLPLIVMWYLRRRRRPPVLGIIAVILLSVLGANVLLLVRNVQTRSQHPLVPTVVHAITHPAEQVKTFMTGADPSEFTVLEVEADRLNSGAMKFHPGATIGSIAVGPIPRRLIGTKPMSGLEHVTFDLFPSTRVTKASFGPSFLGDLYDDDGYLTVVFFSILIGGAMRFLWEYLRRNPDSAGMQMLFAAIMPMIVVLVRNSLPDVLARSIFMTFPVIICLIVCSRPPKRLFGLAGKRAPAGAGDQLRSSSGAIPSSTA